MFGRSGCCHAERRESADRAAPRRRRPDRASASPPKDGRRSPVRVAWWVEGKHFVFYAGTADPAAVAKGMAANAKAGGVTGHPLFQRTLKTGEFESVARGFVDAGAGRGAGEAARRPVRPRPGEKIDALGVGNLKAVVFSSGFQGKESRALYEIDLPGERKGFARVLKPAPGDARRPAAAAAGREPVQPPAGRLRRHLRRRA